MTRSVRAITNLAVVALAAAGLACEAKKSSNPLSPTIAGPIGGVTIEAPAALLPANGMEVVNSSPVRLVMGPASSNSPRPFWFVVEIATDAAFSRKVYTNNRVTPNPNPENGQTTFVLDAALPAGATYYWRVRAEDGANTSEFSEAASFELVVPVVIDPPTPRSPIGAEVVNSRRPELIVENGRVQGRAGPVEYTFQVALDQAFTQLVAMHSTWRSDGSTTSLRPDGDLPPGTLLFWRVYGTNGVVFSAPSATQAFRTPAAPTPPPPPGGGGGGGGGGSRGTYSPGPLGIVERVADAHPDLLTANTKVSCTRFTQLVLVELLKEDPNWGHVGKTAGEGQGVPVGWVPMSVGGHWITGVSYDVVYNRATNRQFDILVNATANEPGPWPKGPAQPSWQEIPPHHYRSNNPWVPAVPPR